MRIQSEFLIVDSQRVLTNAQIEVLDGRIAQLHESPTLRPDLLLENTVILPGLINAHTHLEFSDLTQPLSPGESFPHWIAQVVGHRRHAIARLSPNELALKRREAIQRGLSECWNCGTAWVVDIATPPFDSPSEQREPSPLGATILPEILGTASDSLQQSMQWASGVFQDGTNSNSTGTGANPNSIRPSSTFGFSLHAPYSLAHPGAIEMARRHFPSDALVAMHIAETQEERQWLSMGTGPFLQFYQTMGLPVDQPRMQVFEAIDFLASRPHALLIHGNYLTEAELDRIAETSITVVYCPRTHQHFGHRPYPLDAMIKRGIRVLLGTDSRASNPDLNIWHECKTALEQHSCWSPSNALDAITRLPAQTLGLDRDLGSLDIGKVAWLNQVATPIGATADSLIELLLSRSCKATPTPITM